MKGFNSKLVTLVYSCLALILLNENGPDRPGGVGAFVLQELPLFRSERMESRAFVRPDDYSSGNFERELRSYNFPRWNRLHNYWSKSELMQRLMGSNEPIQNE